MSAEGHLLANLLQLARLLRRLGLPVAPDRVALLAAAVGLVDLGSPAEVRAAARAVLVSRREHLELFERAFDHFFAAARRGGRQGLEMGQALRRRSREAPRLLGLAGEAAESAAGGPEGAPLPLRTAASDVELFRRKDFAELTADEARAVATLLRQTPLVLAPRPSRRLVAEKRGPRLDLRRMAQRSRHHGGEVLRLLFRRRKERPRPLVALCDVSGSMEPYGRLLLQFLYGLRQAGSEREVFVFGTRLTRLSRELAGRNPDRALAEAAGRVVDWSGGTRIGEAIRQFNFDWARRVLGRGAVVLVISDGWDRGDPAQLGRELARLARSCSRLIWLNPLLGIAGYRPLTAGMLAALPAIDDFLPVHNLASLEQLAATLRCLGPTAARRRGGGAGRSPRQ